MGVGLTIAYLIVLARKVFFIFRRDIVLGLALLGPFVIDSFFYASYKSFDFGILLLLIIVGSKRPAIASADQDV